MSSLQIGIRFAASATMFDSQAPLILAIFLFVQVLDGVLTATGITRYGVVVEANALIHTAVSAWGPVAGLLWAKLLASACGVILYATGSHRLLAVAAGAYIGLAVVPWCVVLSEN